MGFAAVEGVQRDCQSFHSFASGPVEVLGRWIPGGLADCIMRDTGYGSGWQ
jgi:hypothetical protein